MAETLVAPATTGRVRLRTGAWYGDSDLELTFPEGWEVTVHRPRTPPPLTDDEIKAILERPLGRPPLRQAAIGRQRPLIVVDDLTRGTPVDRVIPFMLSQLEAAGIDASRVRILVGTGTHRAPARSDGPARKVGQEAAARCQIVVHDHTRPAVRVGTTSFGTPVLVDPEVVASDLVVGLGGVYPHNLSPFGGGTKLALSVLGERSIYNLHYRHRHAGGGLQNSFRRDLDEVARLIGLDTIWSLHVDGDRQLVRLEGGDAELYYPQAAAFAAEVYTAPFPGAADVVVANAYPGDVNLTLSVFKGGTPHPHAAAGASRILIATAADGPGYHGLFPFLDVPRWHRERQLVRKALISPKRDALNKGLNKLAGRLGRQLTNRRHSPGTRPDGPAVPERPVWLLRPGGEQLPPLPDEIPGIRVLTQWKQVLEEVAEEQAAKQRVSVVVYSCAAIQRLG